MVAAFVGFIGSVVLSTGVHQQLTFDAIALRYVELAQTIERNPLLAMTLGLCLYVAAALSALPGTWLLSVAYGLAFGWERALPLVLLGATTGSSAVYWVARSAFGKHFGSGLGDTLARIAEGFRRDAASYLLFLRLAPMFPSSVINIASGLLAVPFYTFAWTTLVGMIPGSIAYVLAGEGLRSAAEARAAACNAGVPPCGEHLSSFDILTPTVLLAFALLALVSLTPMAIRYLRRG